MKGYSSTEVNLNYNYYRYFSILEVKDISLENYIKNRSPFEFVSNYWDGRKIVINNVPSIVNSKSNYNNNLIKDNIESDETNDEHYKNNLKVWMSITRIN